MAEEPRPEAKETSLEALKRVTEQLFRFKSSGEISAEEPAFQVVIDICLSIGKNEPTLKASAIKIIREASGGMYIPLRQALIHEGLTHFFEDNSES